MPITLAKLFSLTATASFPYMDETVHVTFAPHRWTGEMQDLAEALQAEMTSDETRITGLRAEAQAALDAAAALETTGGEAAEIDRLRASADQFVVEAADENRKLERKGMRMVREALATLLVGWDVMDGATPLSTDLATLNRLPDLFLSVLFVSLGAENSADPTKAPPSPEPTSTEPSSAPPPTGTPTSAPRRRSGSPRSSSMNGRTAPVAIPSGGPGR